MADLTALILRMRDLQDQIDELDGQMKVLRKEHDQLRLFDIPNAMAEANDVRSITGEFGRCTLTADLHVSAPDKYALHEWLNATGNGSLIVPTVNAQTLKAFCKEQIKNGEELPDGILKLSPFVRAVLYKN